MDSWRVRCVDTSAFAAELTALWFLLNSLKEEELGAMRQRRNIFILMGCQSVLDVASGRAVLDIYRLIEEIEEFRMAVKSQHDLHMAWVPSHGNVPTGKRETWVESTHTDEQTARARNQCADRRCTDERRRRMHPVQRWQNRGEEAT